MSAHAVLAQWFADLANTIKQSDPVVVTIVVIVLASGCVYTSWRTWRFASHIRLIEDKPTAKIRSAPQGYVELEGRGKLMEGPPIIAKLSGLPCVWFRYKIEELVTINTSRGGHRRWQTIDKGESTETFWLEDETGRVVIDPEGAQVMPRHKDKWRSQSSFRGITRPAFITNYVATHHIGSNYRFTEERINSGDRLYTLGLLRNVSSFTGTTTVDEDVRVLLGDWKKDQPTLVKRFDLNKDGKIDEKEWMLARAQARRETLKNRQEQVNTIIDGLNVLGPTRDRSRPYILSAYTQKEITSRYRLRMMVFAGGCFLLGLAAVWVFNSKFI